MGIFDFFRKETKERTYGINNFKDLRLYEDDEIFYYKKYSENVFNKLFITFVNFINSKGKRVKICLYKFKISIIPSLPKESIKYIVRITKEVLNIKTISLYNLNSNILFVIICEYNESYNCSNNFIGDIQTDISLAFEKNAMDDLIIKNDLSFKLRSNF